MLAAWPRVSSVLNSPIHPSTHPSSTHPPIIYSFIQLPVFPASHPLVQSIHLPIHLSITCSLNYLSTHLSIQSSSHTTSLLFIHRFLSKQPPTLSTHCFYSSSQSAIKLFIIHSFIPFPYLSFVISLSFFLSLLSATRLSTCPSACPVYPPSSLIWIPIDPSVHLPSLCVAISA